MNEATRRLITTAVLTICLAGAGAPRGARADSSDYAAVTYYFIAGLLIVDVGASVGNGISLLRDEPNRLNGYFGVVTGVLSLGLVAVTLAAEDDADLRNNFALMMGSAGTASLILGYLNVRKARPPGDAAQELSRVSLSPALFREQGRTCRPGLNFAITF